jgi:hypothetical protein
MTAQPATTAPVASAPPAATSPSGRAVAAAAPSTAIAAAPATLPATNPALAVESTVARVNGVELRAVAPELALGNPAVLDGEIDFAIRRGAAYLLTQFKNGELPGETAAMQMHRKGLHALCVYALLEAGRAVKEPTLRPNDPVIAAMIAKLKSYPMETPSGGAPFQPVVYGRSLRAAALAVYNRGEDRLALRHDAEWLIRAAKDGAYAYDDRIVRPGQAPPKDPGWKPGGPGQPATGGPNGPASRPAGATSGSTISGSASSRIRSATPRRWSRTRKASGSISRSG